MGSLWGWTIFRRKNQELYDREPFTVEVGNTEDIDKIADILRELGDHYLKKM